jgi:predicted enzyme involved in methoxymalonyl-ACP biosynthesis
VTPTSRESKKEVPLPDDVLREPVDSLSIELTRISAEIESINSGFQAQMQQVVAQVRESIENEYRARMDRALIQLREQIRQETEQELRKDFEAELNARIEHLGDVQKEIERVRTQVEGVTKEIAAMLDDPSIELSRVMRKRTEQAELKAYLDGLRFSIGEGAKAKGMGA